MLSNEEELESRPLRRLSACERRVAELVVVGLSNDEISGRLFLSAKTVEWSVTKVFRKLGVHSRHELAALLRTKTGLSAEGGPPHERGRE